MSIASDIRNIEADRQFLIDCIKSWIAFLEDQEEYGNDDLKLWGSMKEALKRIEGHKG